MWLLINNKCDTAADTDVADMCCWHQRFGYTVFERSCLVLVVHHCVLCCVSQAQDPQMLDQLSKNITRCGLSNSTLNYLRVSSGPSDRSVEFVFIPHSLRLCVFCQLCVILEPMQELMSRHKTYSLSPRDCLKTCLFQKWQRMVAPPGETSQLLCSSCVPHL